MVPIYIVPTKSFNNNFYNSLIKITGPINLSIKVKTIYFLLKDLFIGLHKSKVSTLFKGVFFGFIVFIKQLWFM